MSAETGHSPLHSPVVCRLSDGEQGQRRKELAQELSSGCEAVNALDDGYEFVFPGWASWVEKLARFIAFERECCPFFTFELVFAPENGPISLRMRGPNGAKEFVRKELAGRGGE